VAVLGALLLATLLPEPVGLWSGWAYVLLSTLAFVACSAVVIRRAGGWLARRRPSDAPRTGRTLRHALGWVMRAIVAPLLLVTGPMLAMIKLGWLSAFTASAVWAAAITVGCLATVSAHLRAAMRSISSVLSLGDLVVGVVVWEFVGVVMCRAFFGWPHPGPRFFDSAAQVNVTLLAVAGLLVVFPPTWSEARLPFTWILASAIVMVAGLVCAIAGSLGGGGGPLLVAATVSPIAPAITAFLMRGYARLQQSS